MDSLHALMDKKLGGKYSGPSAKRGGRREDTATTPPPPDATPAPAGTFSTPSRSSPIQHLGSSPRSPLPTRTDKLLHLSKKKTALENIYKEGRIRTNEGSFFSIYNEYQTFPISEAANRKETDTIDEHSQEVDTENVTELMKKKKQQKK